MSTLFLFLYPSPNSPSPQENEPIHIYSEIAGDSALLQRTRHWPASSPSLPAASPPANLSRAWEARLLTLQAHPVDDEAIRRASRHQPMTVSVQYPMCLCVHSCVCAHARTREAGRGR